MNRVVVKITCFIVGFTLMSVINAQKPTLTRDINVQANSGNPSGYCEFQGKLFFSGTTIKEGTELWVSDGTAVGTKLYSDILKGTGSSSPKDFVVANNKLFFVATNGINGNELWKIDSINGIPVLVKDIYVGGVASGVSNLTAGLSKLFFVATDSNNGIEPWVSDGTDTGTYMIKDIGLGKTGSSPSKFYEYNNYVYFLATTPDYGQELWRTDGTDSNTTLFFDAVAGTKSSNINSIVEFNDTLYFNAQNASGIRQLWRTDGIDSNTKVFTHTTAYSGVDYLTVCNNWLYFTAGTNTTGAELFRMNGTKMFLVADLAVSGSSIPQNLIAVDTMLYFTAEVDNGRELYVSNGTSSGTKMTRDLYPIQTDALINNMTAVGNTLFFTAHSSPNYLDIELYKSQGTSATTVRVKDILAGTSASNPSDLTVFNNKLFFTANNGKVGTEMWVSDGTTNGTQLLKEIEPSNGGSQIKGVVAASNGVVFNAYTSKEYDEPWTSTGDSASTKMIKDVGMTNNNSAAPKNLVSKGGYAFFNVTSLDCYGDYFYTNGSDIYEIATSSSYYGQAANPTWLNGKIYYTWNQSGLYPSLYEFTPGKNYGTRLMNLNKSNLGDKVSNLTAFKGKLYFTAEEYESGGSGNEMWVSSGSTGKTEIFDDLNSGSGSSSPSNFVNWKDSLLFFTANGSNLYTTNGTLGSSNNIKSGLTVHSMLAVKNGVVFSATNSSYGNEIWISDGTTDGTKLIKDINSGITGSNISALTLVDTLVYFVASDTTVGSEIWVTDGTEAGTHLVKDIKKGKSSSSPAYLTAVRDWLYFSADDGENGIELWKTNGTDSTTFMIDEVFPGYTSSNPKYLSVFNDTLFFTAEHPTHGNELFYVYTRCMKPSFTPNVICAQSTFSFKNTSDTFDVPLKSVSWEIAELDTVLFGMSPQLSIPKAGKFLVKLIQTNTDFCTENFVDTIEVVENPTAQFTVNQDSQCLNSNNFQFKNTTIPDNNSFKYKWSFGSGASVNSKDANKVYTTAGKYNIKLLVSLGTSCMDSTNSDIVVLPRPAAVAVIGKITTKASNDTFSVNPIREKSTYNWAITNGQKTGGVGTTSVFVKWNTAPTTATVKVTETDSFGCVGNTVTRTVTVQKQTTSIDGLSTASQFEVYPNPSNGNFTISLKEPMNGQVNLYNFQGQKVFNSKVVLNKEISVSHLPTGVYTLEIESDTDIRKFHSKIMIMP